MKLGVVVVVVVLGGAGSAFAQEAPPEPSDTEATSEGGDESDGGEVEAVTPVETEEERAERLEEARLLFLAAQRAFDGGRYADALSSFERSYELAEDPQILYNIAVTLDRLRRDDEALEAFQMYLRLRPHTPDRRDIEARIQIIEEQIARREALAARPPPVEEPAAPETVLSTTTEGTGEPRDDEYTVLDRWWFWTAIVVVAAGGAIAIGLLASQDPDPVPGSDGVVLEALSW